MDKLLYEPYCEFLNRLGHKTIRTGDTIWLDVRPGIFQPAAPFQAQQISENDLANLLSRRGVLGCRWFSPQDSSSPSESSGPVAYCVEPPYDLLNLSQKARNQTRRGRERIEIERLVLNEALESQCYRVYEDNLKRLGLLRRMGQIEKKWGRWVAAIKSSELVELWTAWNQKELAAFAVLVRSPFGSEIVLLRSAASPRGLYPNNALVFEMVSDAFRRGAEVISFGLSGYSAAGNGLDHFKQGMGFQIIPFSEHYSWSRFIRPFGPLLKPDRLRFLYHLSQRTRPFTRK